MTVELQSLPHSGMLSVLRPRQWLKNLLVVAAPLASGEIFDVAVVSTVSLLFILLCAVSAAGYLLNDVRDIEYDRAHPEKKHRAIAAGRISPAIALSVAATLAVSAVLVAYAVFGWTVALLVVAYIATTASYTLWLKALPGVEMVVLSAGFLLRAIIGGVGTGTLVSGWFLIVICASALLVVSGKRSSELARLTGQLDSSHARSALGAYSPRYLASVTVMSAATAILGYAAWVLLVGAYRNEPVLITGSLLPLAWAYLRYTKIIARGDAEAPEEALLRDRTMIVCGISWAAMFAAAVVMSA